MPTLTLTNAASYYTGGVPDASKINDDYREIENHYHSTSVSTTGLDTSNIRSGTAGFTPEQFAQPYGQMVFASTGYSMTFTTTATDNLYAISGVFTAPCNLVITGLSCAVLDFDPAAVNSGFGINGGSTEIDPLTFGVLVGQAPIRDNRVKVDDASNTPADDGTQYKMLPPPADRLLFNAFENESDGYKDSDVPVSAGQTIIPYIELFARPTASLRLVVSYSITAKIRPY